MSHDVADALHIGIFRNFDDQFIVDMSADETVFQVLHGIAENVAAVLGLPCFHDAEGLRHLLRDPGISFAPEQSESASCRSDQERPRCCDQSVRRIGDHDIVRQNPCT